jgi:hypothetical protein
MGRGAAKDACRRACSFSALMNALDKADPAAAKRLSEKFATENR